MGDRNENYNSCIPQMGYNPKGLNERKLVSNCIVSNIPSCLDKEFGIE